MKAIFKFAFLVIITVALAIVIKRADGAVQISAWQWLITADLLTFLICLVLLFVVLYIVIRLFKNTFSLPRRFSDWRDRRRMKNELNLFEKGWVMWLEGKDQLAEKDLKKLRRKTSDKPRELVAAIAGAKFAHENGNNSEADSLIDQALAETEDYPQLHDAAKTVKASILIDRDEAHKALPLLNQLDAVNPSQINIQKLKLKAYEQTGQIRELVRTTRFLVKKKEIEPRVGMTIIEQNASQVISDRDDELWVSFFDSLTEEEQQLPKVAFAAADRYALNGDHKRSAKILEGALKNNPDPMLLHKYVTECPEADVDHRLARTQKWLDVEPANTDLLNATAYLCMLNQLWGQAQRYLTKSLSLQDKPQTHALLGALYDQMDRKQQASEHWRKSSGLKMAIDLSGDHARGTHTDAEVRPAAIQNAVHYPGSDAGFKRSQTAAATGQQFTVFSPKLAQEDVEQYFDSAPVVTGFESDQRAQEAAQPDASKIYPAQPGAQPDMNKVHPAQNAVQSERSSAAQSASAASQPGNTVFASDIKSSAQTGSAVNPAASASTIKSPVQAKSEVISEVKVTPDSKNADGSKTVKIDPKK